MGLYFFESSVLFSCIEFLRKRGIMPSNIGCSAVGGNGDPIKITFGGRTLTVTQSINAQNNLTVYQIINEVPGFSQVHPQQQQQYPQQHPFQYPQQIYNPSNNNNNIHNPNSSKTITLNNNNNNNSSCSPSPSPLLSNVDTKKKNNNTTNTDNNNLKKLNENNNSNILGEIYQQQTPPIAQQQSGTLQRVYA